MYHLFIHCNHVLQLLESDWKDGHKYEHSKKRVNTMEEVD